jgi:hypothetical protein
MRPECGGANNCLGRLQAHCGMAVSEKGLCGADRPNVTEAASTPLLASVWCWRLWTWRLPPLNMLAMTLNTSADTLRKTELGLPGRTKPGCTGRVGTQHAMKTKLGRRCLGRTWVQRMGSGAGGGGGGTCGAAAGTGAW